MSDVSNDPVVDDPGVEWPTLPVEETPPPMLRVEVPGGGEVGSIAPEDVPDLMDAAAPNALVIVSGELPPGHPMGLPAMRPNGKPY